VAAAGDLSAASTSVRAPVAAGAVRHGHDAGRQLRHDALPLARLRPRPQPPQPAVVAHRRRGRLQLSGDDVAVRSSTTLDRPPVRHSARYRNPVGARRTVHAERNHPC